LAAEREERSYQFLIWDDIDRDAVFFVIVMLGGVKRFVPDIGILVRRHAHDDMFYLTPLWDSHTDDIIEIVLKIDILGLGSIFRQHRGDSLYAVECEIGNHAELGVPAEEEPTVVVLLEVIGMYLAGDGFVGLERLIADIKHLMIDDGLEEGCDILQALEVHILLKTDDTLLRALEVQFVFQLTEQFLHPFEMRHAFEAVKHEDGLFDMVDILIGEGHFLDGEIRVFVLIIDFSSVLEVQDIRLEPRIALHIVEVGVYLSATDLYRFVEDIEQGLLARLNQFVNAISSLPVAQAFVYRSVANYCSFVLCHGG